MIQFIIGEKGKGKTKVLLEKANAQIKEANGNIVYLDKSAQHMYELNNRIRLIDVTGYPLTDSDEFIGFICGIISQDHDLEYVYLDSFLKIAHLEGKDITGTIKRKCIHSIGSTAKHTLSRSVLWLCLIRHFINVTLPTDKRLNILNAPSTGSRYHFRQLYDEMSLHFSEHIFIIKFFQIISKP